MDRSVCRGFERLCDTWRPTIFSLSHSLILFLSFPPLHLVHKEEKSTRDKVEEPLGPSVSSYLGPSFQSTGPLSFGSHFPRINTVQTDQTKPKQNNQEPKQQQNGDWYRKRQWRNQNKNQTIPSKRVKWITCVRDWRHIPSTHIAEYRRVSSSSRLFNCFPIDIPARLVTSNVSWLVVRDLFCHAK